MKNRCLNPKDSHYGSYGARGITVCKRWIDSFENFLSDMGKRPDSMSLDRIDNEGSYSPENCRWATATVQSRNRMFARDLRVIVKERDAEIARLRAIIQSFECGAAA